MNKTVKNELKALSELELISKIDDLRRELFSLRLHSKTSPLENFTLFKKLRRNIARALTYLRQKNG